ncbi:methyltransferase domain-containing protein [Candidatus Woesearchaeota archaeon]|nr:methyltransferase domain-containing protein [Candidatus Woesearchaeota archaeon]
MKLIFQLSGENLPLAAAEAAAVAGLRKYKVEGRLLVVNVAGEAGAKAIREAAKRLAYTSSIHRVLFTANKKTLDAKIAGYKWNTVYKESFAVRISSHIAKEGSHSAKEAVFSEKDLAAIIWKKLKKPVVNLESPKTAIEIIITPKTVYCCLLLHKLKHDFEQRKPHLRPGFSPVSLHPKLARAIVNLTGIKKGALCDPFCGTGGLLIEAGLMGFKPVGYDIDDEMLDKAKANMLHCGIENFVLSMHDATLIKHKYDYVATDLPYGRSSKATEELNSLYLSFLQNLKRMLKKRAAVVFPDTAPYTALIKKAGLKLAGEHTHYIHKTLSKKIVVLE